MKNLMLSQKISLYLIKIDIGYKINKIRVFNFEGGLTTKTYFDK
jgi:hypothetical protein